MAGSIDEADRLFQSGLDAARRSEFGVAAELFRQSVAEFPDYAPTHLNLGNALAAQNRHQDALKSFRDAIKIDELSPDAYGLSGLSLLALGKDELALNAFQEAANRGSRDPDVHFRLGLHWFRTGNMEKALAHVGEAVRANPEDSESLSLLGTILTQMRAGRQARQAFELALTKDPDNDPALAQLLYNLASDCEWDEIERYRDRIGHLGIEGRPVSPFLFVSLEDEPARQRLRAARYALASTAQVVPLDPPVRPVARPDRLTIGYFSADFRDHATMYLAARLFELHDRERFEIIAYSYGRNDGGGMRARLERAVDSVRDVALLPSSDIAQLARYDGVDIAVDLKGFTGQQRMDILAYRPAPIQFSYIGYPGTSGAPFIDYLIADPWLIPATQRAAYSEKIVYLPDSYQINDDQRHIPRGEMTREMAGLPDEAFVFCCFNASYKFSRDEFAVWMSLLSEVKNSVLWLLTASPEAMGHLRKAAAESGIDPERLIFAPRLSYHEHLDRIGLADLFLDTLPCNSHTTASDALWCGLPLITISGEGFAARVAGSLLRAVGLPQLIAKDCKQFVQMALDLARSPAALAELRATLLKRDSRLFDSATTTRAIERGYDAAYELFLAKKSPADIHLS